MLNLHPAGNMQGVEKPIGRYMRVGEASNGKDTMTGHWEMMGIKTEKPFKTFTDTGFPPGADRGTGEALRQARDWKQERQRNGDH